MTVSQVGTRGISVYIEKTELVEHNIDLERLNREDALKLLQHALACSGVEKWEATQIEMFPGKDSLLLFARRKTGDSTYFFFSDFEALIRCAACNTQAFPSSLYQTGSGYLLCITPFVGEKIPPVFTEFGTKIDETSYAKTHLKEQGAILIAEFALCKIKACFLNA